jgi:hypothetical protein
MSEAVTENRSTTASTRGIESQRTAADVSFPKIVSHSSTNRSDKQAKFKLFESLLYSTEHHEALPDRAAANHPDTHHPAGPDHGHVRALWLRREGT